MLLVSRLLCWKCHRLLQSQPPSHQPRQGDSKYMRMPLASIMMASQEKSAWTRWRPQARNRGRPTAGQNTTFTVTFQVTTSRKCRARELVSPSTFVPTLSHFAGQADSTEDRDRMAGLGEAASLAICWNNPDHFRFLALFCTVFDLSPSIVQRRQFEKRSATVIRTRMRSRNSDNAANVRPPPVSVAQDDAGLHVSPSGRTRPSEPLFGT